MAANGNGLDKSIEDHFSVIESSDESEPELGLTDNSDIDDESEIGSPHALDLLAPVRDLLTDLFFDLGTLEVDVMATDDEVRECSKPVDHDDTSAISQTPAGSLPACLAAVQSVFAPQEERE